MGNQPTVLLARKDFPANTLQEFASYVRANPGSVQFGSAGSRLDRPLVLRTAQRGARHQECNACALSRRRPCDEDLIAGRYDYICTLSPTGKPLIDANSVKGIAILQPKRSPRS